MSNILDEVMTMQESAQYIGITEGAVRNAIRNNRLKEGIDYKRSGRIKIVIKSSIERERGRGK